MCSVDEGHLAFQILILNPYWQKPKVKILFYGLTDFTFFNQNVTDFFNSFFKETASQTFLAEENMYSYKKRIKKKKHELDKLQKIE